MGGLNVVGTFGDSVLFQSVFSSFSVTAFLAIPLAIGIGLFISQRVSGPTSPPLPSAAVNAGGVLLTELLFVIIAMLLSPEGMELPIGDFIAPLIGLAIGVAAIGAAGGWLGEQLQYW